MFYLLPVITPCYKIILFVFICFCSNASAEYEENNKENMSKQQYKRSIDFPTLFYPGPDNKFITLSPPPTLPEGLNIFVHGQKETQLNIQKETQQLSDTISTKHNKKTKLKVTSFHQEHRSIIPSKPQIQSSLNSDWNQQNTFGAKIPIVQNDQRPPPPPLLVQEFPVRKFAQNVHLNPISTVSTPSKLQQQILRNDNIPQRNFSRITSVTSLPFDLKSMDQIRSGHPNTPTISPIGQVQPRSFIPFPISPFPSILKGDISSGVHHETKTTTRNDLTIHNRPPDRIISHHRSTYDQTYYGVNTYKPLMINQRPNQSGNENEKVTPPKTSFSCDHLAPGYYADLETRCKVFHICNHGRRHTFVCPSETLFNQQLSVCDWPQRVTCPPL